ncbi:MAG: hypothetical protein MJ171_07365, partial [Clostridia bacterium]|nr:hypothetical protein [Clostridia bacterium]
YITTEHTTDALDAACKAEKYYIAEPIPVYEDAQSKTNIVDTLKKGKKVTVIEKPLNGMWRIKYADKVGYVESSCLKKTSTKNSKTSNKTNPATNKSNSSGSYTEPGDPEPDPGDPEPDPSDPDPDPEYPEDPWDPGIDDDIIIED